MPFDTKIQGDTVLVVGASSGIGRETAYSLADQGASVVVAARREERLKEIADEIRSEFDTEAMAVPTDVTDVQQVNNLITTAVDSFGTLDHVVYSAGEGRSKSVEEISLEEYDFMNQVLIDGVFYTTQAAIPHLRDSAGSLVFIGSFAAHYPYPSNPIYGAAKWWTRGFAKSVAGELGDNGISVTLVNPSEVRTEWGEEYGTAFKERFEEGEALHPTDIADAVTFAVTREQPASVDEINMYRRDKFSEF